jgi:hypothetical protein
MNAANWKYGIASARFNPVPRVNRLAERVRYYFDRHPEASRKEFLLEAVRREIHLREQREKPNRAGRPAPSAEDIRIHAWLNERLAALHYERHGLWPRVRRFFFGNRLGLLRPLPEKTAGE